MVERCWLICDDAVVLTGQAHASDGEPPWSGLRGLTVGVLATWVRRDVRSRKDGNAVVLRVVVAAGQVFLRGILRI